MGGLTGKILLAMPNLGDPRFHKAVIVMCAHDENGAMGLVVNHDLPGVDLAQLIDQLNIETSAAMQDRVNDYPVMNGGPVETARGFVLHSTDFKQDDTIQVGGPVGAAVGVTGTIDALKAVAIGEGPKQMRFILGYAGWSAGQLDDEIRQNAWMVSEMNPELLFSADGDEMWDKAMAALGINPAMLSDSAGRA